jgi:hypothetical protein
VVDLADGDPEEEQLDAHPTQRREPPRRGGAGDPGVVADQPRARQQELARAREEAAVGAERVSRHALGEDAPREVVPLSSISYTVGENDPFRRMLPPSARRKRKVALLLLLPAMEGWSSWFLASLRPCCPALQLIFALFTKYLLLKKTKALVLFVVAWYWTHMLSIGIR